jgi:hypothetical protein
MAALFTEAAVLNCAREVEHRCTVCRSANYVEDHGHPLPMVQGRRMSIETRWEHWLLFCRTAAGLRDPKISRLGFGLLSVDRTACLAPHRSEQAAAARAVAVIPIGATAGPRSEMASRQRGTVSATAWVRNLSVLDEPCQDVCV